MNWKRYGHNIFQPNIFLLFMLGPYQLLCGFDYRYLVEHKFWWMVVGLSLVIFSNLFRKIFKICCNERLSTVYRGDSDTKNSIAEIDRANRVRYISALVLLFCVLVSSFFGEDASDIQSYLLGTQEQYNGALTYLLLIISALCVGECNYCDKELRLYLDWFLSFAIINALWGILNIHGFDLFYMHAKIAYEDRFFFYAAMGQKTIYAQLLIVATCLCTVFYVLEREEKKVGLYAIGCVVFIYAGYGSLSDNYFLGIMLALWCMFAWIGRDHISLCRCLDLGILILGLGWVVQLVGPNVYRFSGNFAMPPDVLAYDTVAGVLIEQWISRVLLVILVLIRIWTGRRKVKTITGIRTVEESYREFKIFVGILFLGLTILIGVLIYIPNSQLILPLGKFLGYLRFDDDWGSGRGYIWKNCVTIFMDSSLIVKLFGNGADQLERLMIQSFGKAVFRYGAAFYNAHNEFLDILISFGMVGAVVYITGIAATCQKLLKKIRGEGGAEQIALMTALLGYVFQAFVGLNNIAMLPIFFLLLGLA